MQLFYNNEQSNHGSIWMNCSLDNNQLFLTIVHILCGYLYVCKVSLHLIQIRFSYDNVIPSSLNNSKQNCMAVKDKDQRPSILNIEAILVVLDWITFLQDFEPTVIAYFFVIVSIAFSNINNETQYFNTEFNGLKTNISNSWIKWSALSKNRTNMTLSSTAFFKI